MIALITHEVYGVVEWDAMGWDGEDLNGSDGIAWVSSSGTRGSDNIGQRLAWAPACPCGVCPCDNPGDPSPIQLQSVWAWAYSPTYRSLQMVHDLELLSNSFEFDGRRPSWPMYSDRMSVRGLSAVSGGGEVWLAL